jgi:hypothetical protein
MRVFQWLVLAALFAPLAAHADPPTSDEAKKVYDFIEHGQGQGIVLEDARLCNEIPKAGDHKSECTEELKDGIPAGTKVWVWIAYLIPKGDTISDLSVQIKEGDKVRETKDIDKLEGKGYLARTWTVFTARKAGTWSASIVRGDKELKTLPIKVIEK